MMPCEGPKKNGLVDYIVKKTPVGKFGRPSDFYGISILLASPASDFITGSIIVVDGGVSLAI
jgi:NAD(P)-dependent dehydrogenase (short-subunit alcohol dehydrogenase family)